MLAYLYQVLQENKPEDMNIYADIDGAKVNGGTLPPNIVTTIQRPDLVLVDNSTNPSSVILVELTIPFTRNIAAANSRKRDRYEFLAADIEANGYKCSNMPLEICSRGHISARNRETLIYLCRKLNVRKFQQVLKNCSKLALLGSYSIFNARSASDWSGSGYLKP